jgi:myosin heavy subunit
MVQGAVVQKYLLEKSRIVSQGTYERNYHVFYYLLSGATDHERETLHLLPADKYHYLNAKNLTLENCDEKYEFSRLKQSMEMVGFSPEKQRRLFMVLSAVLLLGNIEFYPKKSTYHHDESVQVRNLDVVHLISELLKVKYETLLAALTSKRVKASGETLIMQYKLPEAIAARDALAKCLYGALFEWIVLQVNHALLNKDQALYTGHSIGVLDIFGFEDFGMHNNFEQICINYANEHLQYYFNLVSSLTFHGFTAVLTLSSNPARLQIRTKGIQTRGDQVDGHRVPGQLRMSPLVRVEANGIAVHLGRFLQVSFHT